MKPTFQNIYSTVITLSISSMERDGLSLEFYMTMLTTPPLINSAVPQLRWPWVSTGRVNGDSSNTVQLTVVPFPVPLGRKMGFLSIFGSDLLCSTHIWKPGDQEAKEETKNQHCHKRAFFKFWLPSPICLLLFTFQSLKIVYVLFYFVLYFDHDFSCSQ